MIFDLQGRRRRLVQAIYALLAVLMAGGLLLFGIGGESPGGLLGSGHGGGGGGHGGGGSGPDFAERAEDLEERLSGRPGDGSLLPQVVRSRYQAGVAAADSGGGHGGQVELTEESREEFGRATSAWERYRALGPGRTDVSAARIAAQAFAGLGDARGAARAQEIVARRAPSSGTLGTLAFYEYAAGNVARGDRAASRALREAAPGTRPQLRRQLLQIKREARAATEAPPGSHAQDSHPSP
ncbi:MAG: hypothetical protein WD404_07760 [Solirubrobacterales bacterium]